MNYLYLLAIVPSVLGLFLLLGFTRSVEKFSWYEIECIGGVSYIMSHSATDGRVFTLLVDKRNMPVECNE